MADIKSMEKMSLEKRAKNVFSRILDSMKPKRKMSFLEEIRWKASEKSTPTSIREQLLRYNKEKTFLS